MLAAPDGILETLTACGCKSGYSTTLYPGFSLCWTWYEVGCSTRRCACQKAELKCTGICSCCECTNFPDQNTDENNLSDDMTMMVAYYSILMAMTLDSMAYLKNNYGNARRYYLRSTVDQYLFTYSIFSFGSTVLIL
jgi:hypothetical protein